MKQYYKYLTCSFLLGTMVLMGCKEDENLNLVTYPVNQPTITITDAEGASQVALKALYKSDGTLILNGPVSRTYTFNFAASPEEATVTFEVISTHIPKENVEMSVTKVVIPAGSTEAAVTVSLKDEDFSFAQSNYEAQTYELGVKAYVQGYSIGAEPIESKVIIKKEAYKASCSIVSPKGNIALFERAYSKGAIVNPDPISYTFKAQLDKPAGKDVKVKFTTLGLDEQFMKNIKITPAEIIIPAGQLSTGDITWTVTDDFLLQTDKEESHTLVVTASTESEDSFVGVDDKKNTLTFNVNKVFRNFELIDSKADAWTELSKTDWSATIAPNSSDGRPLIDGSGGINGSDVYVSKDFLEFVVDMKSERIISGTGIDYYWNSSASAPKKVKISISSDNVTWTSAGSVDTPQRYNHYFRFFAPVTARYMKFELSDRWNYYLDLTEVYMYQ